MVKIPEREGFVTGGIVGGGLSGGISFSARVNLSDSTTKAPIATSPAKPESANSGMVNWGSGNDWPQQALLKIRKNPGLSSGLQTLTNVFSSAKLRYGILTGYNDLGEPQYDRTPQPDVEEFLRVNNFRRFLSDFASEAFRLWNPFVSLYKTANEKAIGRVVVERTKDCRISTQNSYGTSETLFINANWNSGGTPDSKETLKRKLMDPYMDTTEFLTETKDDVVSMQLQMPETGDDYYQTPPWYSVVESGWYDIAQNIPKIKNIRMKNVAAPKWILYIPNVYFEQMYQLWSGMKAEEKRPIVEQEIATWQKCVTGIDNQGKMLWNIYFQDAAGKDYSKWELKALDLNEGGEFLEDSYEAYTMIFRALGFDGSLTGPTPGKNQQGGGSGSNLREGMNALFTIIYPIMDIPLEVLTVVRDFNGWNPMLRFWLDIPYMPSKNEIPTKDRTPQNPTN